MKPEVQEKLLWQERPKTLRGMITAAVKIDNRLHEFNLKKKEYRNPAFRPARIFGGHRNGQTNRRRTEIATLTDRDPWN